MEQTISRPAVTNTRGMPILAIIFMLGLIVPMFVNLGPLRLTPYRLVLLGAFVPLFFMWLSGRMGKVQLPDVLVLFSATWSCLALAKAHGFGSSVESMGIVMIETFGPYLMARYAIRSPQQFRQMVVLLMIMIVGAMPLTIIEAITGTSPGLMVFNIIGNAVPQVHINGRMGIERVQGFFEHPILYGVFCSTGIALAYFCFSPNRSSPGRFTLPSIVVLATFLSLSTGALLAATVQMGLVMWDRIVNHPRRWGILAGLAALGYIIVDIISTRSPFHVFVSYMTFSAASSYNRILIWEFGTAEVWRHPFFGIGKGEWERPFWMSGSMDNFWLVVAVQGGLPAFLSLVGAIWLICSRIGRQKDLPEDVQRYRKGLLIAMVGVFFAIASVHLWNATYCWLMFLIGSGVWIFNEPPSATGVPKTAEPGPKRGVPARPGQRKGPVLGALPGREPRVP